MAVVTEGSRTNATNTTKWHTIALEFNHSNGKQPAHVQCAFSRIHRTAIVVVNENVTPAHHICVHYFLYFHCNLFFRINISHLYVNVLAPR